MEPDTRVGFRKALRYYWKYHLPSWLYPVYVFLVLPMILTKITSENTPFLLLFVPLNATWLVSDIPYWRKKISSRAEFLLYLLNGGVWFAVWIIVLFIKALLQ
jgi:hypothetical protein